MAGAAGSTSARRRRNTQGRPEVLAGLADPFHAVAPHRRRGPDVARPRAARPPKDSGSPPWIPTTTIPHRCSRTGGGAARSTTAPTWCSSAAAAPPPSVSRGRNPPRPQWPGRPAPRSRHDAQGLVHDHAVAAAGREIPPPERRSPVHHDPRGLRCPPRPVLHGRVIDHPDPRGLQGGPGQSVSVTPGQERGCMFSCTDAAVTLIRSQVGEPDLPTGEGMWLVLKPRGRRASGRIAEFSSSRPVDGEQIVQLG